jgi:tetraacyldisaccharide 4'-kinase
LRNKCYDIGIFQVFIIPKKSICVGNLSTGGTGKTPQVAYLAKLLEGAISTSILSRGYGRTTKGFILVNDSHKSDEVGDEPLFYHSLFKSKLNITVCEKRKIGVQQIQTLFPENELIILDDAFQHRAVKAGFNILLTDFTSPFSNDVMLPTGNLREWKSGRKRADCVVVTADLKIDLEKLFFSSISYDEIVPFGKVIENPKSTLLITGIANPLPLVDYIKDLFQIEHLKFADHHAFNAQDIQEIHQKFDTFAVENKIILTTEKDYMRLKDLIPKNELIKYPWYYLPIAVKMDEEEKFNDLINQYVRKV